MIGRKTLKIRTSRSKELAHWIEANLCEPFYKLDISGYSHSLTVTFATEDDRVLLLMRWEGEFETVSATDWRDKMSAIASVQIAQLAALQAQTAALKSLMLTRWATP